MEMLIKNALDAFTFGQVQDAATLLKVLEKNGISTDDFFVYIAKEKRRRVQAGKRIEKRYAAIKRRLPKCPTCGIPMVLREVHPPAPEMGDPGGPSEGCHWTCPKCRYGRYDERSVNQIMEDLKNGISL